MLWQITDARLPESDAGRYLEHCADGAVWCRWPDGRWVEVVPKDDFERLRAVLGATQRALVEMQAQRDRAREGRS